MTPYIRLASGLLLLSLLVGLVAPAPARAQDAAPVPADPSAIEPLDWLEPRGLSVLDFVGQVPEYQLRGSILVFDEAGVTRYLRGRRNGDKVTIEVSISSYENPWFTEFTCLGRRPLFDEWPVPVPPSQMRVFSAGQDISADVLSAFWHFPAEQAEPVRGSAPASGPAERYVEERSGAVQPDESGALPIPANMGCTFFLSGSVPDLTAEFVFEYPRQLYIEHLGSKSFNFHSYIGVGDAGRLDALSAQLRANYADRHDKFPLNIPPGADYMWLNYPPSPVSAYASATEKLEHNIRLPSSGTYRLIGFGDQKSVDHVVSMGLPLRAQWFDADLDSGDWLERISPVELISSPEYFVPPGVPYDPCMKDGGCPLSLLGEIYNTTAKMTVHYYRVRRLLSADHELIPLRAVGPDWKKDEYSAPPDLPDLSDVLRLPQEPAAEMTTASVTGEDTSPPPITRLHLPVIFSHTPPPTHPDDEPRAGCPCGWFDDYYRLLDVVPGPELEPPPGPQ